MAKFQKGNPGRPKGSVNRSQSEATQRFLQIVEARLADGGFSSFPAFVAECCFAGDVRLKTAAMQIIACKCFSDAPRRIEASGPDGSPVKFQFVEHRGSAVS